ncbi:hypothetical protein ACFVJW_11905 [Streptomyces libani]
MSWGLPRAAAKGHPRGGGEQKIDELLIEERFRKRVLLHDSAF